MSEEIKTALKSRYVRFLIAWCFALLPLSFFVLHFFGLPVEVMKVARDYMLGLFGTGAVGSLVGYWLERKNNDK